MIETYSELPTWKFDVQEVSAGVYEVVGTDDRGRRVQFKGTDPDRLLDEARSAARAVGHL
jgi:hypothetical protein